MRQGSECAGVAERLGKVASGDKGPDCRLTNRKIVDKSWMRENALVLHNLCPNKLLQKLDSGRKHEAQKVICEVLVCVDVGFTASSPIILENLDSHTHTYRYTNNDSECPQKGTPQLLRVTVTMM